MNNSTTNLLTSSKLGLGKLLNRFAAHGLGLSWAIRNLELELIGTNLRGGPKYNYCPVLVAQLVYEDYKGWFFWLMAINYGWLFTHAMRFTWMLDGQVDVEPVGVWLTALALAAGFVSLWRMMQRKRVVILRNDLQD